MSEVCECGRRAFFSTKKNNQLRSRKDHPRCSRCHRADRTRQGQRRSFLRHSQQDLYIPPVVYDSPRLRALKGAMVYLNAFTETQALDVSPG